jgi:AcrR family transcriptional regulator
VSTSWYDLGHVARATVRQNRQESRDRIVRAAELLVRKRSYSELTVDELMSEAGLGRTIFYRHFDDLGDLLMRTSRDAIEQLWDAQSRLVLERPGDPRPAFEAAAGVYGRYGPLLRCVREAADVDERVAEGYQAMRRRFDDFAEQALRDLLGDRAGPNLHETARALNLMNETYLTDAFGREPRVTPEVAVQTLAEIWDAVIGR